MVTAALVKELREKTGAGMMDCKKVLTETDGDLEKASELLRERGIAKAAKKSGRVAAEGLVEAYVTEDGKVGAIVEVNAETDFVAKNEEFQGLVKTILETIIKSEAKTLEDALKLETSEGTLEELIVSKTATIGEKLSLRRFAKITKNDNETFGEYIHMGGKIAVLIVTENTDESVAKDVAMHAAAMRPKYVKIEEVPEEEVQREKEVLTEQAMNEGKPKDIAEKMVIGRLNKFYKEICLEEQPFVKDDKSSVKQFVKNNGGTIKAMYRYEVGEGMEKKEEHSAEEVAKQMK